mmetsp:Transcript_76904/g.220183  ORF Transcript_76904/g.220183 Transcript_76904/m.220183 type:complete len:317 (+) Transcript_76904:231-1181(+)
MASMVLVRHLTRLAVQSSQPKPCLCDSSEVTKQRQKLRPMDSVRSVTPTFRLEPQMERAQPFAVSRASRARTQQMFVPLVMGRTSTTTKRFARRRTTHAAIVQILFKGAAIVMRFPVIGALSICLLTTSTILKVMAVGCCKSRTRQTRSLTPALRLEPQMQWAQPFAVSRVRSQQISVPPVMGMPMQRRAASTTTQRIARSRTTRAAIVAVLGALAMCLWTTSTILKVMAMGCCKSRTRQTRTTVLLLRPTMVLQARLPAEHFAASQDPVTTTSVALVMETPSGGKAKSITTLHFARSRTRLAVHATALGVSVLCL